jgi:hypothetical protein
MPERRMAILLRCFSGNSVIDTLRLHDSTQYGFVLEKTASNVNILAVTPTNPPVGLPVPSSV